MKRLTFAILALLVPAIAFAQSSSVTGSQVSNLCGLATPCGDLIASINVYLTNGSWLKSRNAADNADLNLLRADTSDNTELNVASGKTLNLSVAGTPVSSMAATGALTTGAGITATTGNITSTAGSFIVSAAGQGYRLAAYVPTFAATPVAGTNLIAPGLNVAPTAAANTAAMFAATPVVGTQYRIFNSGPNTVRLKGGGATTINGATAGGYIALATLTSASCVVTAASNINCSLEAAPTPAGP